ncbi:OmpA/MotB family protein [Hydrogenophaga sp. A37]|uniref:OmpA/MotB family protein n=1 Tax=Hydrogenophaga sp. A37 TaxID=1945864 RepID=UPI001C0D25BE|nr:flagellar motor protein MotB [Hydrogenophaga sp. A37]
MDNPKPLDADNMPVALHPVPTPTRTPRVSTSVGRYRRWHVDTRPEPEEEGWLITYLDVITLILVLMVVMLAMSGPKDNKKPPEATQAQTTAAPAATATAQAATTPTIVPPVPLPVPVPQAEAPPPPAPKTLNGFPLDQLGNDIEVLMNDDVVRFRISSEILFDSGAAALTGAGHPVLDRLIPLLNADPALRLVVEGHTDGMPINSERFPSNWELSTARAASVARYLIERGVAPQRVQATGFADTRPLAARDNPVDRVHNRRVELTMERSPQDKATNR